MTIEEILKGESKEIEYKECVPSNSKKYTKTAVAYANCSGGRIVFGVENDTWKIVGIPQDKVFETADAISNAISDSCEPAINFDILYQTIEGKTIIIVEVVPGNKRPYYLKAEGSKAGVYIRIPGATKSADDFVVKELEFQGANRCYDQMISVGKIVTNEQIDRFCEEMYQYALKRCRTDEERKAVKRVGQNNLVSWGLLERQGKKLIPTNGFMLLTENELPAATIQCAVFKGKTRAVFVDRKEYEGPLYRQIDEAYQFVLRNIRMGAEFGNLYRRDVYELPIDNIRELIVNAVAHRSYLDPSKVQVAIYDDRLEVTSPGMLIGGVTIQELKEGCSRPRNRGIVNAFTYMKNMDQWGSGIPRLFENCKTIGLKEPELLEIGGSFRVNLFRNNELNSDTTQTTQDATQTTQDATQTTQDTTQTTQDATQTLKQTADTLTDFDKDVIRLLAENPQITQKDVALELGWKIDRVKYYVNKLKSQKIIKREGSNHNGRWNVLIDISKIL